MRLFELLRGGVPVAEVVEFENGNVSVSWIGEPLWWATQYPSLDDFEQVANGELIPRHAPHAFLSDRGSRGVRRAWVQEPA